MASRLYVKIGVHFDANSANTKGALLLLPILPKMVFTAQKYFAFLPWKSYFNFPPATRTIPRYDTSLHQGIAAWSIRISLTFELNLLPIRIQHDFLALGFISNLTNSSEQILIISCRSFNDIARRIRSSAYIIEFKLMKWIWQPTLSECNRTNTSSTYTENKNGDKIPP